MDYLRERSYCSLKDSFLYNTSSLLKTPLDTCKSYTYLSCMISNNGSFKLNINKLCKIASRVIYNLLGNVNKNFSGNLYILIEVFAKMILPICTYNC